MSIDLHRTRPANREPGRLILVGLPVLALVGCISVSGQGNKPIETYVFELPEIGPAVENHGGPVLLVTPTAADSAVRSRRIVYLERPYEIRHYAYSQWADRPEQMLGSLLVGALAASGDYEAVVEMAHGNLADLRLDTELLQLQHEYLTEPSQVRVRLRGQIIDLDTRTVLATRNFEVVQPAPTDDPYGAVMAANQAVAQIVQSLVGFCEEVARDWQPPAQ